MSCIDCWTEESGRWCQCRTLEFQQFVISIGIALILVQLGGTQLLNDACNQLKCWQHFQQSNQQSANDHRRHISDPKTRMPENRKARPNFHKFKSIEAPKCMPLCSARRNKMYFSSSNAVQRILNNVLLKTAILRN